MSIRTFCDRCGLESTGFHPKLTRIRLDWNVIGPPLLQLSSDLCNECVREVVEFATKHKPDHTLGPGREFTGEGRCRFCGMRDKVKP